MSIAIPGVGAHVSLAGLNPALHSGPATGATPALGLQEGSSPAGSNPAGSTGVAATGVTETGAPAAAEGAAATGAGEASTGAEGLNFGSALSEAIASLDSSQQAASGAAQELAMGTVKDPESAVMTVEDAQMSMDLASQIRTKATEAMQTIFQTQV